MRQCILNIFGRHALLHRLAVRRGIRTETMQEGEQIFAFTNRIRQLPSTLKSMGIETDDKKISMPVLKGLPEQFKSLICALDAFGNAIEDADEICLMVSHMDMMMTKKSNF